MPTSCTGRELQRRAFVSPKTRRDVSSVPEYILSEAMALELFHLKADDGVPLSAARALFHRDAPHHVLVDVANVVVGPGLHGSFECLGLVLSHVPGVELAVVAVRVCVAESLLNTLIVAPGETVSAIGENMKFEMVIWVPVADDPDDWTGCGTF